MPPTSISGFETIRELGNGGQGKVTLVKEKGSANPPRLFACKQIPCPSQTVLDSAVSEIKVLLKLSHPHIIRYEDFFITIEEPVAANSTSSNDNMNTTTTYSLADWQKLSAGGGMPQQQQQQQQSSSSSFTAVVYLLTEYCESGDMSHLIRRTKEQFMESGRHSVAEERVLDWILQCCDALEAIHKLGFLHHDVKPTNCFLAGDGTVKLGDFGLAAPMLHSSSSSGGDDNNNNNTSGALFFGTPAYAPPEVLAYYRQKQQQQGGATPQPKPTAAVDVWGLGVTMLELLTLTDRGINAQVLERPREALDKIVADVTNFRFSRGLAVLVRDMLQRRAEDRPTPAAVVQRIKNIRSNSNSSGTATGSTTASGSSRGPTPQPLPNFGATATNSGRSSGGHSQSVSPLAALPPAPGTKCSICHVFDAAVVCPACNDEPLCRSCDDMKHRSSQRHGHVRTPVSALQRAAAGSTTTNQQQQQQQHFESSGPSSVGSSFDNGRPAAGGTGGGGGGGGALDHYIGGAVGGSSAPTSSRSGRPAMTTVDINNMRGNSNNNNNNIAKPKPVMSNSKHLPPAPTSGRSNPVTPTSLLSTTSGSGRSTTNNTANNNNNHGSKFPDVPPPPPPPPQPSSSSLPQPTPRPLSPLGEPQQQPSAVLSGPPRPTLEVPSTQYPTIAAALAKAESGSRILVSGGGVYREALEFVRPDVEVVGNNNSSSSSRRPVIEVRGTAGCAVRITESAARTKLCNLTIVHQSSASPSLAQQQQANMNDAAAVAADQKQFAILVADAPDVVIESCDVTSESGSGIGVAGAQCNPLVSGCTVTAQLNGIHISAGASDTVYRNTVRGTTLAAILVKRKASPRIISNTLDNNRQAGIFFFRAGGLTDKNTITNCGGCAVVLKGGSNPTVRRNRIQHCAQAGILISDESRGTVSENVILNVRKTGILVKTGAAPTIVRNHISHGMEAGIYVFENGGGRIEENEISDNANAGIIVTTGGSPVVVANRVVRNTFEGIWVCNDGAGKFERNVLEENGRRGAVDIQPGCKVEWVA